MLAKTACTTATVNWTLSFRYLRESLQLWDDFAIVGDKSVMQTLKRVSECGCLWALQNLPLKIEERPFAKP